MNSGFSIDKLNIALVFLSAILALVFPLELFLIAYAIIGPLHYVTEINWLSKKDFFYTRNPTGFVVLGVLASLSLFLPKLIAYFFNTENDVGNIFLEIGKWSNLAIFSCLILAISNQIFKATVSILVTVLFSLFWVMVLNVNQTFHLLIGFYVPTIIHVYIFTLLFMYYGAKKNKSKWGMYALYSCLLIPILIILINVNPDNYYFSDYFKNIYLSNNFHYTPINVAKTIGISDGLRFYFYEKMELKLMMFIAFIYCYHYLNWFSKTGVIKWHKQLNRNRWLLIIGIWCVSIGLYIYNFRLGFLVSLFLSFLHVILEFPLNILTIKSIFSKS